MDFAKEKKLKEIRSQLHQGDIVFVDQGSLKDTKFDEMNWTKCIIGNQEMVRFHVEMKDLGNRESVDVKINKNKTIQELKELIGKQI